MMICLLLSKQLNNYRAKCCSTKKWYFNIFILEIKLRFRKIRHHFQKGRHICPKKLKSEKGNKKEEGKEKQQEAKNVGYSTGILVKYKLIKPEQ